ncbi:PAQR family membrane homeostasis protein TrhA [Mycolicibacterium hodleri]|uniref:Hemolysin III family protein n=1 Tax=Mycolicibacterium hodleri TaxID=49897 RepID=A0A502EAT0_9MYCO|nr:hemolysin III family protein [Mycolicibacterium hodleri]TPG33541.1 hemolysin III family protein [Mycolicibacterium hodleri]
MSGSIVGSAEAARTADVDIPEILRGDDDLPQVLADTVTEILHTPSARGAIHLVCAAVAIIAGAALVPVAWLVGRPHAGVATLVYATTIIGMFTVSAVYHRVRWDNPATYKWMKRADHSMIFLFIAGSYTPLALLAMPPDTAKLVLTIVYSGAAAGVALKMFWPSAPRWVGVPLYLVLGYTAIWFAGVLLDGAGLAVVVLLCAGAVLYNIGAVLYGVRWPNPWPQTFGYHEFFHAFTAAAAACHYVAIWFVVV